MANSQACARLEVPPIPTNKQPDEMNDIEKMITCQLYNANDPILVSGRLYARKALRKYNTTIDEETWHPCQDLLEQLLGTCSKGVYITPPFQCDYGSNIHLGENVYMNFNCVLLDACEIRIGDNTFLAPGVQLYTATHPLDDVQRLTVEYAKPITIGKNCWIGGGVIVLPGITIGDGSVIGAGSVVTKDVESYVVVAGNPAKVIRKLVKGIES